MSLVDNGNKIMIMSVATMRNGEDSYVLAVLAGVMVRSDLSGFKLYF